MKSALTPRPGDMDQYQDDFDAIMKRDPLKRRNEAPSLIPAIVFLCALFVGIAAALWGWLT